MAEANLSAERCVLFCFRICHACLVSDCLAVSGRFSMMRNRCKVERFCSGAFARVWTWHSDINRFVDFQGFSPCVSRAEAARGECGSWGYANSKSEWCESWQSLSFFVLQRGHLFQVPPVAPPHPALKQKMEDIELKRSGLNMSAHVACQNV